MKSEFWSLAAVGIFVAIVAPTYWFITKDPTGTWALGMTVSLFAFLAFFLWTVGRAVGVRPEDDPDGEIADGAGELGFFPPFSWWPLFCGLAFAVVIIGVATLNWWVLMLAAPVGGVVVVGWVFEYYRGVHAH